MEQDPAPDDARKAKLALFLVDLIKVGSLKGFKYFETYLRGREELVLIVKNEPSAYTPVASPSNSLDKRDLPRNEQSLMLSGRTQRILSGYGYINIGLPPASPSEREVLPEDSQSTAFLIAGYARYCCPYVWVRSNHERLIRLSGADQTAKDNPLKLKTTTQWSSQDVRVWDVIAELVNICTLPTPANPFSVDMSYFDELPSLEASLACGSTAAFLQNVIDSGQQKYEDLMRKDIHILLSRHFEELVHTYEASENSLSGMPPNPIIAVTSHDEDLFADE